MFPPETVERDQLEAGLPAGAAETAHALDDARRVLQELQEARTALTLPVYKSVRKAEDLTAEELKALRDNDPVAGTEYREMATLFLQMHDFACDVSQALSLRGLRLDAPCPASDEDGPSHPPRWWPSQWNEEAIRLMVCRSQSLLDGTRGFTRPLG